MNEIESSGKGMKRFVSGDVLFNKLRPYLAKVFYGGKDGCCGDEFLVLRPKNEIVPKFLFYRVLSIDFINLINNSSYGVKMPRANWDYIGSIFLPYPNQKEQRYIVSYLDQKTAQIDDLIQKKEEMIKLLKEKRAAIINQAVTKGLDLNAQMKPSGIDWIGNIPKHWETVCLRRVLKFWRYGISETLSSCGKYGILRMGDIVEGEICFDKLGYVDEVADELILNKYDLVFNRTNSLAQVGKVGLFRGEAKDNISLASYLVKLVVKNKHDPLYVWYTLNSSQILEFVRAMALPAIGQANLNPERYSYVKIPIPTFDEQRKIAEYLNHNTAEIDGLINKIESAIAKLREYRSSLITAAVTGKIDVRGAVKC